MLINYRHYTAKEMIAILSQESLYFSRHPLVARGNRRALDAILLEVELCEGPFFGGMVRISCEFGNNCESMRESLHENGFVRNEAKKKDYRLWTFPFTNAQNAGELLDKIMAGFNEAMEASPLLLYASPAQKALADYQGFMKADFPKVSYGDIMQYLGYEDTIPEKAKKDNATAPEYMTAQYRQGRWAAWASGDLIVPLFDSEYEAEHFLQTRAKLILPFAPITIKKPLGIKKELSTRIYKLVDQTKSIDEKIAWLQREIAYLRRQEKKRGII